MIKVYSMTAIMDLSFPGQRIATANSCIPHDSVYMPGPHVGKSENGFFRCDTWLQILQKTPKFVTQKSQWLHSSIKFANPAHKLVFESVLDISIIFRCTKRKQPVLLLTKFMSHSKHNFSNCLKYKNNISHTHQRWVNTIQLIAELHSRAKRACGRSSIAKEMW